MRLISKMPKPVATTIIVYRGRWSCERESLMFIKPNGRYIATKVEANNATHIKKSTILRFWVKKWGACSSTLVKVSIVNFLFSSIIVKFRPK